MSHCKYWVDERIHYLNLLLQRNYKQELQLQKNYFQELLFFLQISKFQILGILQEMEADTRFWATNLGLSPNMTRLLFRNEEL